VNSLSPPQGVLLIVTGFAFFGAGVKADVAALPVV
jgi:hypothetical protein